MQFEFYKSYYFNIILILLLLTNNLLLFFLVFISKMSHFTNLESDLIYVFDFGDEDEGDMEDTDSHMDFDIDDEYIYTLMHEESYLIANCRFFFDLYGGETLLDYIDFIDFNIYNINDNRNLKYLYVDLQLYKKSWNLDSKYWYKLKNTYLNNNNMSFEDIDVEIEYNDYIKKEHIAKFNILASAEIQKMIRKRLLYKKFQKWI